MSAYERSRLRDIEAALEASDPALASALRTFTIVRSGKPLALLAAWLIMGIAAVAGWWFPAMILSGPLLVITMVMLGDAWPTLGPEQLFDRDDL